MKSILVFGGAGRIGSCICNTLAENKLDKVYSADINPNDHPNVTSLKCNVTNPNSIVAAMERVMDEGDTIDVIVNAAYPRTIGYGKHWPFPFSWDIAEFININLLSSYTMIMEGYVRGCRNMVFLSSMYGDKVPEFWIYDGTEVPPTPPEYAMSKAALNQMVRYYSKAVPGLKINAVAPGGIKDDGMDPQFIKNYESIAPFTDPYDVAQTVKYLVEQDGITGEIINVTNGWDK